MNASEQSEPLFLRVSAAALLLNMSRNSVYQAMRAKLIPAVQVAGKWRIPSAALQKLIDDAMAPASGEGEG